MSGHLFHVAVEVPERGAFHCYIGHERLGDTRAQAEYAASLLNAGIEPEEVQRATQITTCSVCERVVFLGTVDDSERCARCAP